MQRAATVVVDTSLLLSATDPCRPDRQRQGQRWLDRCWRGDAGLLSTRVLHENRGAPMVGAALLTEDLRHVQAIDGVRLLNPFLVGPAWLDAPAP